MLHNKLFIILLMCFIYVIFWYEDQFFDLGWLIIWSGEHVIECMFCATNVNVSLDMFLKTYFELYT
jgi:hypothetical protein